ncbi:circadian associated repressor of transcription a [Stegastes partitus]|uniref:Circadian associated repressor of transcription n=1 Tax=Stegastes partitus TaxID=144197 RepID=A0A3B4Z748_9TELE|nr:PREDICTED: circadian-associated transcriptional repressor [Stegastes partitus]
MNSLGNSSKWPSYDSLPSTSSFLLSESEQTEDEADVFSEGEGDSGTRKSVLVDERITLSGNYLDFPPRPDPLRSVSNCDQSELCPDKIKHPDSASSPGAAALRSSSAATPGDLAFAQKCADLHRFTHPLLELLQGLKTGRFDRGLTSFQQSVAIDRLQRILGILQKPEMGEKYLQNLLQIEMLLKMWFPQMAFKSADAPNETTTPKLGPHWRQSQLHMPVKKRKLSWSDPDRPGKAPAKHYHRQHGKYGSCHAATLPDGASTSLPGSSKKQKTPEEAATVEPAGDEFTDGSVALSRPSYLCSKRENESRKQPEISPPSSCGSPATQDSSVSSSNTITTTDSP